MSEKIDRVARAIDKCAQDRGYRVDAAIVRHLAVAAIDAMHEPDDVADVRPAVTTINEVEDGW